MTWKIYLNEPSNRFESWLDHACFLVEKTNDPVTVDFDSCSSLSLPPPWSEVTKRTSLDKNTDGNSKERAWGLTCLETLESAGFFEQKSPQRPGFENFR